MDHVERMDHGEHATPRRVVTPGPNIASVDFVRSLHMIQMHRSARPHTRCRFNTLVTIKAFVFLVSHMCSSTCTEFKKFPLINVDLISHPVCSFVYQLIFLATT